MKNTGNNLTNDSLNMRTDTPSEDEITQLKALKKDLDLFLKTRFKKNLKALEKFDPMLARRYKHYTPSQKQEFFCSLNGIPNLYYPDSQSFLYATEDPIAYCENDVDNFLDTSKVQQITFQNEFDGLGQIHHKYHNYAVKIEKNTTRNRDLLIKDLKSFPNLLMVGVGLGYHLARFYEKVEIENLVLVEPNPDLFFASLHTFDWANLFEYLHTNNNFLNLIIGVKPKNLYAELEKIYIKHGRFLAGSWWIHLHQATADNMAICRELKTNFSQIHNALGWFDDHLFATSQGLYLMQHKYHFALKKPLLKKYKDVPIFIVGNGPSLDKDINFLRKYQDKAFIIACGTALDPLYHAGIQPDFYANTERTYNIGEATLEIIPDKNFFNDITILATDTCHPNTVKFFKHSAIFGKDDEPLFPYLESNCKELGKIATLSLGNPLVGNMGVASAIYFGFEKLYLFGIDNGRKIGSKMHSTFSTIYNEHGVGDEGAAYSIEKVLPGNFGGEFESSYFFDMSRRNIGYLLQRKQENNHNLTCYNCSDGSYIENTISQHSDLLKAEFDTLPDIDKKAFLKYLDEEKTAPIFADFGDYESIFHKNEFNKLCDKYCQWLAKRPVDRPQYVALMAKISADIYALETNAKTNYIASILNGTMQDLFILVTRVLYHTEDLKTCLDAANSITNLIVDFLKEAPGLYAHMPDYIMWEHRKHLGDQDKVGKDTSAGPAPKLYGKLHIQSKEFDDPVKIFIKKYK